VTSGYKVRRHLERSGLPGNGLEHFLIGPVPVAGVLLFLHEQLPVACAIPLALYLPWGAKQSILVIKGS
jgi:hypothetical protein